MMALEMGVPTWEKAWEKVWEKETELARSYPESCRVANAFA